MKLDLEKLLTANISNESAPSTIWLLKTKCKPCAMLVNAGGLSTDGGGSFTLSDHMAIAAPKHSNVARKYATVLLAKPTNIPPKAGPIINPA